MFNPEGANILVPPLRLQECGHGALYAGRVPGGDRVEASLRGGHRSWDSFAP